MPNLLGVAWLAVSAFVWTRVQDFGWLFILGALSSVLYIWYQALFLFGDCFDQPVGYNVGSSILLVFDIVANVASGIFCGLDWLGVGLLALAWLLGGRTATSFAKRRITSEMKHGFENSTTDWSPEKRDQVVGLLVERRIKNYTGQL